MIMDVVIIVIFILGLFFFAIGVLGLLRFPDAYTRLHATTKCDTLGVGLVLLSLMLYQGFGGAGAKLALMIVFIWVCNPTAAHIIAKAALSVDIPMILSGGQYLNQAKEDGISS